MLPGVEVHVERRGLQRHAGRLPDACAVLGHVEPGDPRGSRCGWYEGREHLDRRRLAGPVGPEEAVYLSRIDVQVDAVDRAVAAVLLDQPLDDDVVAGVPGAAVSGDGGAAAGGSTTASPDSRTSMTVSPISTRSPVLSVTACSSRCPFTNVPLVEPRSWTMSPAPAGEKLACLRETSGSWSSTTSAAPGSRPTTTCSPTGTSVPACCPAEKTSTGSVGICFTRVALRKARLPAGAAPGREPARVPPSPCSPS